MHDCFEISPRLHQFRHRRGDFCDHWTALEYGAVKVVGRPGGHNLAAMQNQDARAGQFHFRQNVGGEKNGMTAAEVFDELAKRANLVWVEATRRLSAWLEAR